jgi:hypothetical protein
MKGMDTRLEVELRELSVPECFALLATATVGHLAITHMALPLVIPVRIDLVGKELMVMSLLGNAVPITRGSVVALEASGIGSDSSLAWTVEVRGFLTARRDEVVLTGRNGFAVANGNFHLSTEEVSGWCPIEAVIALDAPLVSVL